MAFVTAKSDGRFEVRETRRTPAGPRATTLATFRVFNDDVFATVKSRAAGPVDAGRLRDSARRAGAPIEDGRQDQLARQLLGDIAGGRAPSPGLRRALADALARTELPDDGNLGDLAMWIGVSDMERAKAMEDLLGLADAIPVRRRRSELAFPRLTSRTHG